MLALMIVSDTEEAMKTLMNVLFVRKVDSQKIRRKIMSRKR